MAVGDEDGANLVGLKASLDELAGDPALGLEQIKKGIELQVPKEGAFSGDRVTVSSRATYYLFEGEAFEHSGRLQEALRPYEKTVELSHLPVLAAFPRCHLRPSWIRACAMS